MTLLPQRASGMDDWLNELRRAGLLGDGTTRLTPLTGGVSSDIVLVESGSQRFVVKRALAKLRVSDDWFANPARSNSEQAYLRTVGAILPASVPRVLFADPQAGWFAMEYLENFSNWKNELMLGRADPVHARRAGETLGTIHRVTWRNEAAAREFATGENFYQLRIEPYLETAAKRVPDLASALLAEAARLRASALALVHGDFSPKNILVSPERNVLVDAEVAWFGDPAFDTAFLLCHLHLKALRRPEDAGQLLGLSATFWAAYTTTRGETDDAGLEARTVRLLLCLLLARIHGKSPVEYLTEPAQRELVVKFVREYLPQPPSRVAELSHAWHEKLLQR